MNKPEIIDEESIMQYMEFTMPKLSPLAALEMVDVYRQWNRRQSGRLEGEGMIPMIVDTLTDEAWFFCPKCEEEYLLPEDTDACPICENKKLEAL